MITQRKSLLRFKNERHPLLVYKTQTNLKDSLSKRMGLVRNASEIWKLNLFKKH